MGERHDAAEDRAAAGGETLLRLLVLVLGVPDFLGAVRNVLLDRRIATTQPDWGTTG